MKQRTRFLVLILCAVVLLTATSCNRQDVPSDTLPITAEEEALLRYESACENVRKATDLTMEVEYACSRTVGGETYSEEMTETITYRGVGTADAAAAVKQQVAFGPYQTQYAEFYHKGSAYCKTEDSAFRANMNIQQFINRQIPAILADAALYDAVDVDKIFNNTVITFSEPKNIEKWATDYSPVILQSASATVTLNKNGDLAGANYAAQYSCGSTVYDLQVKTTVKLEAAETLDKELSGIPAKCPVLTYFDAPRKILQVVGDVYTAQALSAEYTETVYSAAYARSRSQTSSFDTCGAGAEFMAQSRYEVINTDYSNTPVTNSEVVIFQDGACISSLNGEAPTAREEITADAMRAFCEDAVLAALFTPNHLENAKLTEKQGQLRIDFAGNTAFADNLCNSIYSIFSANLDTYAQSYTTPTAGGYLCVDKASGLPTALGITLERVHVAGEVSYPLTYELNQTMQLSSETAYKNIVAAIPQPETTPTEPATNPE